MDFKEEFDILVCNLEDTVRLGIIGTPEDICINKEHIPLFIDLLTKCLEDPEFEGNAIECTCGWIDSKENPTHNREPVKHFGKYSGSSWESPSRCGYGG